MKTISLLTALCMLFAGVSHAVVDTLYSEPTVDGGIDHYGYNNSLQANTIATYFMPGDGPDLIHGGENFSREYLSFNLSTLPESINIQTANLKIDQYRSYGNDSFGVFPHWTGIPGGDTMSCIIDHISYGAVLDTTAWKAGDIGDPKTITNTYAPISATPDTGWKTINVTPCVKADVQANRTRSQFRMRFQVGSDYDGRTDVLYFHSGNSSYNKPMLIIDYTVGVAGIPENRNCILSSKTHNYPNPFRYKTQINYSIKQDSKIVLNVYTSTGQMVIQLVNDFQNAGKHRVIWDGRNINGSSLPAGVYYYQLKAGNEIVTQKTIILK